MKVVLISKALVVGAYQRKLEEMARLGDIELTAIVPPYWREPGGRRLELERAHLDGYRLLVEPIRFNGSFHLFYFPGLAGRLRQLRPEVVHVDEEPYNLATYQAVRSARAVGARATFFSWQNLPRRYPPPWSWMERYVYRHSAHAIVGNHEAELVLRGKGYRGPTTLIPQFGVDPERFAPAKIGSDDLPSRPFTVGYVGRLVQEKGLLVLMEAVAGLGGEWRLALVGDGPLREALQSRIRSAGLDGRVELKPPIPSEQVPDELRQLDVLVLPSLTRPNWKEQFGRSLVEAMACGVAVVGSSSGEIPKVIGEAGRIVPEGDANALRRCLEELMSQPQLRRQVGDLGRQRVLGHYTHRRIAEDTVRVYREVIEG